MKTFSVIIPCYNSEKYIDNCLLSLINQDYDFNNIEVLVVDDGSTDNIATIMNKYNRYQNIKYIKKQNGQWGSVINYVRQNKLATNEYISVLDADDMLAPNAFSIINKKIKDNDVFVGSFRKFNGKKLKKKIIPYWFLFKRTITDKKQMNSPFCLPLSYFYKREIFYCIHDLREKVAYQDPDFISQIINLSNKLIFTRKTIGYYYFNREGNSISQEWTNQRFDAEYHACLKCIENNAPEIVSYRLNLKPFYKLCLQKNIIFKINHPLNFKWFPIYIRVFYSLLHKIKYNKLFEI